MEDEGLNLVVALILWVLITFGYVDLDVDDAERDVANGGIAIYFRV